jgi:peptidoglycan/LPS O-acetylase OafA/YrhL
MVNGPSRARSDDHGIASAHIPELDGIRGIAILLVLLFHGAKPIFGFGWMGVDLFFVLSGFLITLGLLKTAGRPHYFRDFYVKRALRIWPLYYLLLAYVFILLPVIHPAAPAPASGWVPYALYLQNFIHPLSTTPELGTMWSLAVEEHFYLVWPLVVFLVPRDSLRSFALGIVGLALALRLALAATTIPPWFTYFATPCRMDALAMGALLSLALTGSDRDQRAVRRWAPPVAIAGGVVSIVAAVWLGSESINGSVPTAHPMVRAGLFSVVGLASVGFVGFAMTRRASYLSAFLRAPWLRYLGTISYGIYVYHMAVFELLVPESVRTGAASESAEAKLIRHLGWLALTLLVASLSWYAFEKPILRLKSLLGAKDAGILGR